MKDNGPPATKTVLIVDDEPDARTSLSLLLGIHGYRAVTAENGAAALQYLRNNPAPGLILLDLRMPGMSGVELREQQLRDRELALIPVVACSGAEQGREDAALWGMSAFYRKPADPSGLLELVRRHCGDAGRASTSA
jgi:CheY-like chemotaxis protein